MKTELEIFQGARALLTDPKKWTTGAVAKDAEGNEVQPYEQGAVCFCLLGALNANFGPVISFEDREKASRLVERIDTLSGVSFEFEDRPVAVFNDTRTHAEVLDLLDRAIAEIQQEVKAA